MISSSLPNWLFIWSLGTIQPNWPHLLYKTNLVTNIICSWCFPFISDFFSISFAHSVSSTQTSNVGFLRAIFFSHHIIFSQGQLIHAFLMVSNNINKKMSPPSYRCSSALSKWQHYLHAGVAKNLGTILRYRNLSLHCPSLPIIHPLTNHTHFTS